MFLVYVLRLCVFWVDCLMMLFGLADCFVVCKYLRLIFNVCLCYLYDSGCCCLRLSVRLLFGLIVRFIYRFALNVCGLFVVYWIELWVAYLFTWRLVVFCCFKWVCLDLDRLLITWFLIVLFVVVVFVFCLVCFNDLLFWVCVDVIFGLIDCGYFVCFVMFCYWIYVDYSGTVGWF